MGGHSHKRARILIVDDHPAVREALAVRIASQPDLEVCGQAADPMGALRLAVECQPDVAVVDVSLKTGNGIDLVKEIKARNPHVWVLVWSIYSESHYAQRALTNGALGYITKDEATHRILEAIQHVRDGRFWLNEEMAARQWQWSAISGSQDAGR